MKRVTVVFDDEELYRAVKVEAARTGRTVKDIVTEALRARVRREPRMTEEEAVRLGQVLDELAKLRAKQKPSNTNIADDINEMRLERVDHLLDLP